MKAMPIIGFLHPLLILARPTSLCQRICVKLFFQVPQLLAQPRLSLPTMMYLPTTMRMPTIISPS